MIEELLPFYTFKGNLLPMKHVKENVAVALFLAALIVVAFWGIELRLLLLTVLSW